MKISGLFVAFTLICSALSPAAQAQLPPPTPDGGYTGGNTAEGQGALFSVQIDPRGSGGHNTAIGFQALFNDTTGNANTATGEHALFFNTRGRLNTATGSLALQSNTTGQENVAIGFAALERNETGNNDVAIGGGALSHITAGSENTAIGQGALFNSTTGFNNVAVGAAALLNDTIGSVNIALGPGAGKNLTTGNRNIDIGNDGVAGEEATIRIGTDVEQTRVFIAGVAGKTTSDGVPVLVSADGKLGTRTSSARFKDDIKPMDKASEVLFALRPVAFRYKKDIDPAGIPQFGLVAEDVAKVNPDLVVRDKEGKPYTVRYDAVNAMLLNEFLKEHKAFVNEQQKVARLEASVAQQHKDFEAAVLELKGQIQKVSAQLEASKTAPRVVSNP